MRDELLAQRLSAIQKYGFPVLSLEDALLKLRGGTLPDNTVCITIDDGFFSVLNKAAPLLKYYDMPATVYITSYYSKQEFPIYRLVIQYIFWKTSADVLDLSDQRWGPKTPVDLHHIDAKEHVTSAIINFGEKECDEKQRQTICSLLGERLGIDHEQIQMSRMLSLLNPEELARLGDWGIDVQLHTHRHQLPSDNEELARREIRENRDFLEGVLRRRPSHFCYPSGEWATHQWPWLTAEGVASAVTCEPGLNTPETPVFALYRVLDEDGLPQIVFEAELFGFSELIRIALGRRRRANNPNCLDST